MNKSLKILIKNIFKKQYSTDCLKKTVLGIETSCDDTGVAIVNSDRKLIAESKYNQWSIHKKLGHARSNKNSNSSCLLLLFLIRIVKNSALAIQSKKMILTILGNGFL